MRNNILQAAIYAAFFVLALSVSAYAGIGGSASLSYSEVTSTSKQAKSTMTSFTEVYMLNMQKRLTNTMSLMLTSSWTKNTVDMGNGSHSESEVSPVGVFSFNPPSLYSLNFGYTRTESDPSDQDHITTSNAFANMRTPVLFGVIAPVALNYSRQRMYDHASLRRINTVSDRYGANTGYSFDLGGYATSVAYTFSGQETENMVSLIKDKVISHGVSGSVAKVFSKKVSAALSASYQTSQSTSESTGGLSRFPSQRVLAAGYSCSGPCPGSLTAQGAPDTLIDNNLVTAVDPPPPGAPTSINLQSPAWHIGGKFSIPEAIYMAKVYITTTPVEENNIQTLSYNFDWRVYSSSDNVTWTLVTALPTVYYDSIANAFEISFPETTALYFKVVNFVGTGMASIDVTELQFMGYDSVVPKYKKVVEYDAYSTALSIGYVPIEDLKLSYSFGYSKSVPSEKYRKQPWTYTASHGFGSSYVVHPRYLTGGFTASFVESGNSTGTDDSDSTTYALSLSSRPLDTVNSSLALSRSENASNGKKSTTTDARSLLLGMRLYHGIDLTAGLSNSHSESYLGTKATTDATAYYTTLLLMPRPSLTFYLNGSSGSSSYKSGSDKRSSSHNAANMNFVYRPLSTWVFGGSYDIEPGDSQSYYLSIVLTRSIQFSAAASFIGSVTSETLGLSWRPAGSLSLNFGYTQSSDSKQDVDSEALSAYMSISI